MAVIKCISRILLTFRWYVSTKKRRESGAISGFSVCAVHLPLFFSTSYETYCLSLPEMVSVEAHKVTSANSYFSWISQLGPQFGICGKNVQVLLEPSHFYTKLKELSRAASERITIASLYIGIGPLEQELVSCLHDAVNNPKSNVKAKILLDFTRGSRGEKNSRTLLIPLLRAFPNQVEVALYHTPVLRGWIKWLLPERWNEIIGLTHLKVYLFDDTIILSGANLSDQYFTNRQDRYVVFHNCKGLADFFDDLVCTVSKFSLQLKPDNSLSLHPQWSIHPSDGDFNQFVTHANQSVSHLLKASHYNDSLHFQDGDSQQPRGNSDEVDTWVYPLLQMYPLGIRQDEHITKQLMIKAQPDTLIKLASGYFNLTDRYMDIILQSSQAYYNLLVASPKVNGFYGASGIAGAIPSAYTYIAKQFYQRCHLDGQKHRISLQEYEREAWTFHVKGLWYYLPGSILPSLTLIGSPNFGYRSVYKDLEAQVAIVTHNISLQQQLHYEQERLFELTTPITQYTFEKMDRHVPFWVKLIIPVFKTYF